MQPAVHPVRSSEGSRRHDSGVRGQSLSEASTLKVEVPEAVALDGRR